MEETLQTVMYHSSVTGDDNLAQSRVGPSDPVSDQVRLILQWVFFSVVSEAIALFGTAANIINIICFIKQGFQDSANITLLGLAVSDLGSLITLIWVNICFNPAFNELDLPFEPIEIQYLTGSGPHVLFTRVTGCLTALITFVRCMCVTMPLKVKTMFTRKVVTSVVVFFFVIALGYTLPGYYVTVFAKKFSPIRNRTILGLVYMKDRNIVETVVFAFSSCFVQMGAFIMVVVCTILLVVKLNTTVKWRQLSAIQVQGDKSKRDHKVNKMVVIISTVFIVCFIPVCIVMVVMILEPEFSIQGRYRNVFISTFSLCFVLESTNSAMNICIYYQMSSKYRATFRHLFKCRGS